MRFAWLDLRTVPGAQRAAIVEAAVHARLDGVVDDVDDAGGTLSTLPPTVKRIRAVEAPGAADADIELVTVTSDAELHRLHREHESRRDGEPVLAAHVDVRDNDSLALACSAAVALPCTVVAFRDPTKIPLEIVIAAADRSPGRLICQVSTVTEARIVFDVLEKGSEGVLLAPRSVDDVLDLAALLQARTPALALTTLTVRSTTHSGLGDRVCVDTCSHLREDEGILVGSYAHGFVLCSSETHPLPYMPTRPFRVNAGALHSYVLGVGNRTNYLSELESGSTVLAVSADGSTRPVVVGRIKLESRPLLTISASSPDGVPVSLAVQDDWHVRVLGPGAEALNVTELEPGDQLLGHLATDKRHVGLPVGEFCIEK
ncbi:MAG: 3-dehydroquinate synthase II family protein [Frankiaceae bacterium]